MPYKHAIDTNKVSVCVEEKGRGQLFTDLRLEKEVHTGLREPAGGHASLGELTIWVGRYE